MSGWFCIGWCSALSLSCALNGSVWGAATCAAFAALAGLIKWLAHKPSGRSSLMREQIIEFDLDGKMFSSKETHDWLVNEIKKAIARDTKDRR